MTCSACGEQPKNTAKDFTKAVIEINNPETLVLFRKVVIPTSMGDETAVPAAIGKYHNVLLVYEANGHAYLYSSDGIPTLLTSDVAQDLEEKIDAVADDLQTETANRQNADTALGNRLTTVEGIASTAVQPAAINKIFMTDISVGADTSTTTVQLNGAKENILTGATSTKDIALPVASTTQAGVMNSSTYDAVTNNTNSINAIMNGAVAITGISANPSQSDLTTAWQTETGLTTLINRASIYDVTNNKVWTYYTNDTTWHVASNTSQVTINTFTNSSEGTIKGSTNNGQVFAEADGTGSINGWDTLNSAVSGKQDALTAGSNITISDNIISATNTTYSDFTGATSSAAGTAGLVPAPASGETNKYLKSNGSWETISIPTVNNATLTIQKNGTNVATFTANSNTNETANITVPTITMQTTDPGEGQPLAANNFIGVYE